MPCNALATVRAKIEAKHVEELLLSEPGLRALVKALVPNVLRAEPTLSVSIGQAVLRTQDGVQIILDNTGLRVVARYMSYASQQELTRQVAQLAQKLAIPLAQERLVQGLKARYGQYAVTSDQAVGAARVVKLRIPL